MGQAKLRKMRRRQETVYHHTSTLRTNLLWMSGVIEVEGKTSSVLHPELGEINTNARLRRSMTDFPPVAWFTNQIEIPKCLLDVAMFTEDKITGERKEIKLGAEGANVIALNRIALGFPISQIGVIPWPEHPGYSTAEGRELNETAIECGDNPEHWYVSESAVDILKATEVWSSSNVLKPKLRRVDTYLADVHRMVKLCRERPGVFIPPTWLTQKEAAALSAMVGVPAFSARGDAL